MGIYGPSGLSQRGSQARNLLCKPTRPLKREQLPRLRPIHLTKSELLHFQDVIDNRAWFAGSPEDAVTYLEELQDKYPGPEQVMIAFPMGATTTQFREQMGRFAAEVIPHFKKETAASA